MSNSEPVNLSWLVISRSEIQTFCLEVLTLIQKPALLNDKVVQESAMLLVGAAFSLWRAVFLSHGERTDEKMVQTAIKYLERVIKDNTISYGDDSNMREWSFGYYLNNARFRIQEIGRRLPVLETALRSAELAYGLSIELRETADSQIGWTACLKALRFIKVHLDERLPQSN